MELSTLTVKGTKEKQLLFRTSVDAMITINKQIPLDYPLVWIMLKYLLHAEVSRFKFYMALHVLAYMEFSCYTGFSFLLRSSWVGSCLSIYMFSDF